MKWKVVKNRSIFISFIHPTQQPQLDSVWSKELQIQALCLKPLKPSLWSGLSTWSNTTQANFEDIIRANRYHASRLATCWCLSATIALWLSFYFLCTGLFFSDSRDHFIYFTSFIKEENELSKLTLFGSHNLVKRHICTSN